MRKPRNYSGRYSGQQNNQRKKNGIMVITAVVLLLLIFVLSFMLAYHFLAPGSSVDPNAPDPSASPIVSETPAPTPDARDARIEELEEENKALIEENEALRAEVEKYQSILGNSMTATQAPTATPKPTPTPTPTPTPDEGGTQQ